MPVNYKALCADARHAVDVAKSVGLSVYMKDEKATWLHCTDGEHIAYVQWDRVAGFTVSSVHMPSRHVGTGYQIERHVGVVTPNMLKEAMHTIIPAWDRGNAQNVKKWESWDKFMSANSFNSEYELVETDDLPEEAAQ